MTVILTHANVREMRLTPQDKKQHLNKKQLKEQHTQFSHLFVFISIEFYFIIFWFQNKTPITRNQLLIQRTASSDSVVEYAPEFFRQCSELLLCKYGLLGADPAPAVLPGCGHLKQRLTNACACVCVCVRLSTVLWLLQTNKTYQSRFWPN